ncbi:MAG: FMN-binding protein [Candidatus Limnocylindrales bacterium]
MPRRGAVALLITSIALVLLLNFKTPDATPALTGSTGSRSSIGSIAASAATPAPAGNGSSGASGAQASGSGTSTVDGTVISTRYGDVQVEITLANGRIADVVALQLPTGRRSGSISAYAGPILRSEALQAQNATIDTVSGATYTSTAYAQSLQAALDQAGH